MKKKEFDIWLKDNNWWDSNYYYFFTDKIIHLKDNQEFNDAEIKGYFKRPRDGGNDLAAIYKTEEVGNDLILHIEGIKGRVEFFEHYFRLHQENGNVIELNQYKSYH